MEKLKNITLWFAIFLASFVCAGIYMIFIRLQVVDWVEANCAANSDSICFIARIFAFNWRVMLIPAAVFAIFGLKYTKHKPKPKQN
jgi:hypothetical protein